MKTILFIRHAKSERSQFASDFERALTERGQEDAKRAAIRLPKEFLPDRIITSTALRARQTAEIFAQILKREDRLTIDDAIYDADDYLPIVQKIDDWYGTVFFVGHNPTIAQTCELLTGNLPLRMRTCSVYGVRFVLDSFAAIEKSTGNEVYFDFPE
ncbi:MAG: histidine phosphatase family protein [Helicobacteraceae bacterium]|jgi:phosphohistidine phosphatase|nr:histidine phosphatase family protein [Helicobacteraceae bacterium]